VLDGESW